MRSASPSVTLDAALAGSVSGFLCGKVIVGDPYWMALAGAVGFAAATRWPKPRTSKGVSLSQRFVGAAYEGSSLVARLRSSMALCLAERRT